MHQHGTMKGRWKALAFGALWFTIGFFIARLGWRPVFAEAVPQPPTGLGMVWLLSGATLMLIGAVLGLTPHLIWFLRALYKEDFAQGARCPVMLVCPGCQTYNPRGRPSCKACHVSLAGARAAGGNSGI